MDPNHHLSNPGAIAKGWFLGSVCDSPPTLTDALPFFQLIGNAPAPAIPVLNAQNGAKPSKRRKIEHHQAPSSGLSAAQLWQGYQGTAPLTPPNDDTPIDYNTEHGDILSRLPAPQLSPAPLDAQGQFFPTISQEETRLPQSTASPPLQSPFKDLRGTIGKRKIGSEGFPLRSRTEQVSTYLKFSWPLHRSPQTAASDGQTPAHDGITLSGGDSRCRQSMMMAPADSDAKVLHMVGPRDRMSGESAGFHPLYMFQGSQPPEQVDAGRASYTFPTSTTATAGSVSFSNSVSQNRQAILWEHLAASGHLSPLGQPVPGWQLNSPKLVPPQFGEPGRLELMERRFFRFLTNSFGTGRATLRDTNPYIKDFAPMVGASHSIRNAANSLIGLYIYSYTPTEEIASYANGAFARAEGRLSELYRKNALTLEEVEEFVVVTIFLSLQDIVFTVRREAYCQRARWLEGFKQCERLLDEKGTEDRFWRPRAPPTYSDRPQQLSHSQISGNVVVARNAILTECLLSLPERRSFDRDAEGKRFGWLLAGSESDMFAIHGACGFSRLLLFRIRQVTFYAASTRIEASSVHMLADLLLEALQVMRQFSKEAPGRNTWDAAKGGDAIIVKVRQKPKGYVVTDRHEMTDVTAEAWRIATMIYLQCRALRLPRDHEEVVANMGDLSSCIRIMPTDGPLFTAQAPLLPIFLLGSLAIDQEQRQVSEKWFEQVVAAPVLSSVPPLYAALKYVWKHIDTEIPLKANLPANFDEGLDNRDPWWERYVEIVKRAQKSTLCPT